MRHERARQNAVLWLWPLVWVALTYTALGRIGFNPSDEGYVLAQAHRLLAGEVPHRDFVSPRPLGAAILHVVDFALPGPLFEASRVLALAEVVAFSTLLAALVYGLPLVRFGPLHALGAAAAAAVDLHGFPLMAWHTIDGLLLVALGLVAIVRASASGSGVGQLVGAASLGAAAVVKQSFALAPLLAPLVAWPALAPLPWRARAAWAGRLAAGAAALPALYAAAVAVAGGGGEMMVQLGHARPTFGEVLLAPWWRPGGPAALGGLLAGEALLLALVAAADARARRGAATAPSWERVAAAARLALCGLVLAAVFAGRLRFRGNWGAELWWMLAVLLAFRLLAARRVDRVGLTLFALAWMSTLSWGYANPNLVGGVVGLHLLVAVWRGAPNPLLAARPLRAIVGLAAVAAAFGVGRLLVETRRAEPYFDLAAAHLDRPLGEAAPAFGGIRSSPVTAAFVRDLVECVARHPARRVAVLPDNAWVYPALGLRNPLPLDWLFPPESAGSEERLVQAARELSRRGDALVLFQTFPAFRLREQVPLRPAAPDTAPFWHDPALGARLLGALEGERIACHSFVGIYAPPRR